VRFEDIIAISGASGFSNESAYNPHLHFQVFLPELKYKKCKDKICSTPILNNMKNRVDPFPYLLQEVELRNISEVSTLK
jgi:murein DD-endopeptidase MepM/ murein hydrolase activator NlpD